MAYKNKEDSRRYGKMWYYKNHDRRIRQIRDFQETKRKIYFEKIIKYFLSHPCVDCGNKDIRILEFDHLKDKEYSVMKMIRDLMPWDKIYKEISKCEIRCSNCHKIKHYKNSFRDIAPIA